MEALTKVIISIMKDNKYLQVLFIAACFAVGLVYIQHLTIDSQKKLSEGLEKAVNAQVICQDELRELRKDLKDLEIELVKLKEK